MRSRLAARIVGNTLVAGSDIVPDDAGIRPSSVVGESAVTVMPADLVRCGLDSACLGWRTPVRLPSLSLGQDMDGSSIDLKSIELARPAVG